MGLCVPRVPVPAPLPAAAAPATSRAFLWVGAKQESDRIQVCNQSHPPWFSALAIDPLASFAVNGVMRRRAKVSSFG